MSPPPSRRPPRPAASPYRRWATRGAEATRTPTRAAGTTRARAAARCRRWRRSSCSSSPSRSSPSPSPRRGSRTATPAASAPSPADPSATLREMDGLRETVSGVQSSLATSMDAVTLAANSLIVDAVVAARILNATLVVPKLDQTSFWKDSSNFSEIFDIDWFISFLAKDVKIIKEPPEKGGKAVRPYKMRVPRKCTPQCYLKRVLPALLKKHVIRMTKYDYRLSNKLDTDLQKLRCRVNYHALRFTHPIHKLGEMLIQRMREKSRYFIALHLRFESDMLAFSGCYYGGGEKERRDLGAIRKRWKTLHTSNPEKGRRQGRCPLTPEEVGLMLRALGYGSDVHIYAASGEIYGGKDTLAPLKALFPNFHTKESLASKDELTPFLAHSSRMAAIDFIVCDGSDAFVTNNNGNMAKILAGRRRYFGHKRTIRPNAKQLYPLFMNRGNMSWDKFTSQMRIIQKGFMGDPMEVMPGRGEFHANPAACICEKTDQNSVVKSSPGSNHETIDSTGIRKAIGEPAYPIYTDEETDGSDSEDDPTGTGEEMISEEDLTAREEMIPEDDPAATGELTDPESDDDSLVRQEDSELEEILSD